MAPVFNVHPPRENPVWAAPQTSYNERFNRLISHKLRVAYIYEVPDTSTFRYRVTNMLEALSGPANDFGGSYFISHDLPEHWAHIADAADVLVVCRYRYDHNIAHLINKAHTLGKRVVFDIDDLVFDTERVHELMQILNQNMSVPAAWDYWYSYISRMAATMRMCDLVTTTTPNLASKAAAFLGKPARVIPNFLNSAQIRVSKYLFAQKQLSHFRRRAPIIIGYFSGSPTHDKDFDVVASVLEDLLDAFPQLLLRLVGFLDLTALRSDQTARIDRYELCDLIRLQSLIAETDVNIIPLQYNTFTNCKSELKFFEAGIVGTISLASPTSPFTNIISSGRNGFLCPNHDSWLHELRKVLAFDDDQYMSVAQEAYRTSLEHYAGFRMGSTIETALLS